MTDDPTTASRATPSTLPSAAHWGRSRDLLVLALLGATSAAVWHLGVIIFRARVLGRLTWTSDDLGWMAPVGYLALFAALAAPLALLVRLVPSRGAFLGAAGTLIFVTVFSMLLLVPGLAPWAMAVLATGAAAELARRLVGSAAAWRWARRLAVVSATACALLAAESIAAQAVRRGPPSAATPPAGAPNVLLIILDTVRSTELSLYGYQRQTSPALERLAATGTTFDRALSAAPWTLPSHASIFSGRRAAELRTSWRHPWVARDSTLAELFRSRGYVTGGFVANLLYTLRQGGLARGFETYRDFVRSPRQTFGSTTIGQLPWVNIALFDDSTAKRERRILGSSWRLPRVATTERKDAARVTDEFLRWQRAQGDRRFFAFLNYFDAHTPFLPPGEFATRFGGGATPQDRYDGAIASLDAQLGRLFDDLARRGVLDRTLVIVTADHGEQFGEHGLIEHGNSLYMQLLHVPLVMRWPGHLPAGRRVAAAVSLRDLGATVLDLTGSDSTAWFPGASFAALAARDAAPAARPLFADLARNPNPDPPGPNQFGAMEAIFSDRFQYVRNFGTGRQELFDYVADPTNARDLSGTAVGRDQMASLRALGKSRGGQP